MKHVNFVLVLLFMVSNLQYATPPKGATLRQVFLGCNDQHYFTLAMISATPGSHYEGYDSTFIYKIDIQTNRVVDRALMTAAHYRKKDEEGWSRTSLLESSAIDMNQYMVENDVHFAFTSGSAIFSREETFIDMNGLYLIKDEEKVIKLLLPDEFLRISGIPKLMEVVFKEVYHCHRSDLMYPDSESYYFLKFEYPEPNTGYRQETFLPLSVEMVREKLKK